MLSLAKLFALVFLIFLVPLGAHAAYWTWVGWPETRHAADWSSAGVAPDPATTEEALVLVYSARVGRWRGIFAVHSWIAIKERGAPSYTRYDVVGWGTPLRENVRAPDARWFGNDPVLVAEARGRRAEAMIPKIRAAVANYRYAAHGDYRVWPGPNSNTFVAAVLSAVPEFGTTLPPTAIGKDFPHDQDWLGRAASGTGIRASLGGYAGVTIGWVEGIEVNFLGLVAGLDLREPAIKLPGFGRLGF